jgi:hypothetical protein
MYDSMIHCAALGVARSCARITGKAAFTTEPSMNVMLDASIVEASTARAMVAVHGGTSPAA